MSKICSTTSSLKSPFCEHFNTNYVPTEAGIERIRAHLMPHEAELARLEALIQELTAQRDRVKYESKHAAIVDWLERSAPLPVALSVTGDDLKIFHSLLQFSSRWRALHFSEILVETLYKLAGVDVPLLTEIHIKVADGFEDTQSDFLCSNLFRTMQSGRIFISGAELGAIVPKQFTWDNITHISLDSQSLWGRWGERAYRHRLSAFERLSAADSNANLFVSTI
ncbi:hypothetical protein C8R45DRAFT_1075323 [Mycena sanguinolenta]|nr:hypothetical protein C8R45DRAFT_1075323 [Mycena sanguinolenta]